MNSIPIFSAKATPILLMGRMPLSPCIFLSSAELLFQKPRVDDEGFMSGALGLEVVSWLGHVSHPEYRRPAMVPELDQPSSVHRTETTH